MTVREVYIQLKKQLSKAGVDNAGFEVDVLLEHVCGGGHLVLAAVTEGQWEELMALAARRAQGQPLQYLVGEWSFLGLRLRVGPGVLIPRPETEEVCLAAAGLLVARAEEQPAPVVLDLCAGSGVLALGLQSRVPGARVTAVELSPEALVWLKRNIAAHVGTMPAVPTAVQADVLEYYRGLAAGSVDMIMCNPPYVTEAEYEALEPELYHEPKMALVPEAADGRAAPDDGLLFYRAVVRDYKAALAPGGALVFEIGSGQGEAVREILLQNGYIDVGVRRDMSGNARIALGHK